MVKELTPLADIDVFSNKVKRKLDNIPGLFVSMTGFQLTAISEKSGRSVVILMDGANLMAILDRRLVLNGHFAQKLGDPDCEPAGQELDHRAPFVQSGEKHQPPSTFGRCGC